MAEAKIKYGSTTAIAITSADGNVDGAFCSSALVDNATNLFIDALVGGSIQVGTMAADGYIHVYAVGSWDGTEFTAGVDAGDADITWGTTGNTHVEGYKDIVLLASISVDTTDDNNDIVIGPLSVKDAFGSMPMEWAIVIENDTGATFHATGTNNHLEYTGITFNSA